jgi:hypothetical protein
LIPFQRFNVPNPQRRVLVDEFVVLVTTSKDSQLVALNAGGVSGSWAWHSSTFVTRDSWIAGISDIG